MEKERLFFEALKNIFVGAQVEGESGFINLMRIKSRYYEKGVFPRLKEDIDRALAPFPEFREELFDRLYTFFRRYFSESGSIYFRFTPPHEHVYEKVYTDDRDVALFWKTHMLYYVKTDRLFRSMAVEVDGFRFFFDVSTLEHKRANEKRALVYAFKERREDGTLVFSVAYSEGGRKTNLGDIRRAIKDALGLKNYTAQVPSEETLERAFRLFERQSEVDFFINKNARRFLQEQFNLWLYQYVFEPEERRGTVWTERRIRQLQVLKEIAYKIIDFIAQFEDELVRIWNKPKFVLGSHYVITLDRIVAQEGGPEVLERLFAHPGMEAQVQEWRDLGMVEEGFAPEQVWVTDLMGRRLHERYQFLPLDTRHFPDLEIAILALFDHLDQALDGWLVHSENYQALNTMLPKFRERVKCIYIDPPYNSPETEIHYVNRFRDASWISLMENRLHIAKMWLQDREGAIFVAVDDYEMTNLGNLLTQIFPDFEINTFIVVHHPQGSPKDNISRTHEYTFMAVTRGDDFIRVSRPSERSDERPFMRTGTALNNFREGRPNSFYAIVIDPSSERIVAIEDPPSGHDYPIEPTPEGYLRIYPIDSQGRERVWRKTAKSAREMLTRGMLFFRKTRSGYTIFERTSIKLIKPTSVWSDSRYNAGKHGSSLLTNLFGGADVFSYPKAIYAVEDFVGSATYDDPEALILDFFAGSGTTAHAVINLNREDGGRRKYILVEMGDYFHTVLLPRIKKVVFSDRWKDGKAQPDGKGIGHFVKYFRLEQYEEVLRKAHYRDDDAPLFLQDPYTQYVFLRDPKMLDNAETGQPVVEVDPEQDEIRVDLSRLYPDIDLAETLSCLTGRWIRRIRPSPDDTTQPGTVEFEDGTTVDLRNPQWERIKPLIWW